MGPRPSAVLLVWLCAWSLQAGGGVSDGARILALLPVPARSHMISFFSLTKALALKGHDVTVITPIPFKENIPNHKVISIGNVLGDRFQTLNLFTIGSMPAFVKQVTFLFMGLQLTNNTLYEPEVVKILNDPNEKFDLILAEIFFCQETFMGLGHRFNAPVVALNPSGTNFWMNDAVGNPVNPAYTPNFLLEMTDRPTFLERVHNTYFTIYQKLTFELFFYPRLQGMLDQHFPGAPPLRTLLTKQLALTLVNNHHSLFYPAPMAPNVIEVGGMHISHEVRPLPKDLQTYLDSAKEGVVYFSMGSNLRVEQMEEEKKDALISCFGALKMRVLMKWDGPRPKTLPANIRLEDWLPQSDLLGHPNIRLFVTHGGLLSTQEAVFHGVPLVALPVFGDQQFNARLAVLKGFAVRVDHADLTKETFGKALQEVLSNPKYTQTVKKMSGVFRSQPVKPLDQAVFWIEHILAHGWEHLRPASTELWWAQVLLLDVLAASVLVAVLLLLCCRALCCRRKSQLSPAKPSADQSKRKKKN